MSLPACDAGGLGNHIWDVPLKKFVVFLKIRTVTTVFYCLGIMLIKLSLLLFYLQLAVDARFRLLVCALIWIVVSYSIASMVVAVVSCYPVSKSWDPTIQDGGCVDLPAFYLANLSLNSATDIAVLLLPALMLWGLPMPLRDKIAVSGVFMTGIGVCVVSLLRIRAFLTLLRTYDVTWEIVEGYIWSSIELNTAILCAALLFAKPLLRSIRSRLFGSNSGPRSVTGRRPRHHGTTSDFDLEATSDTIGRWSWKRISLTTRRAPVSASESQAQITAPSIP